MKRIRALPENPCRLLVAFLQAAIEDPANERWLSPASLLEIALKVRIGKLSLHRPFGTLLPKELAVLVF